MTMSNQMSLSAASVAVMANNNTLVNMGAMQNADYLLDGSTINAGLEATTKQATAEKNAITDQAEAVRINAGCQMGGSALGIGTTITGMYTGWSANSQAELLENPTSKASIGLSAVEETGTEMKTFSSTTSPASATGSSVARIAGETEETPSLSVAKVQGELDSSVVSEDSDQASLAKQKLQQDNAAQADAADQTKKDEAATEKAKQDAKAIREAAKTKQETFNAFGNLLSSAVNSASGFATYNTTIDQANQTQIKDLESGLASALNSQANLIGSQLGSLDQARTNTYQLMSTLQHIQG